ncbi:hypothetical protein ABZ490_44575 [Streptomyces sp. NPDC005811]|uniref:hypothetical protein n=1 Tax=Streptomyces sp. NPDC005811 TaxID=3154565 RepID=UPI0033C8AC43
MWALTQLIWSHAELTVKVTSLEGPAESIGAGALPSTPTQTLDTTQRAIADRIRRLEHYVQSQHAAERAEQAAVEQEERRASLGRPCFVIRLPVRR